MHRDDRARLSLLSLILLNLVLCSTAFAEDDRRGSKAHEDLRPFANASRLIAEGRDAFRFDTFGDEAFWGGRLRLHEALAEVPPSTALAVGLKLDVQSLPRGLRRGLKRGLIDLDDPAVTAALLELNAVVGVTGFFEGEDLVSVGVQCALCHSTVDDSFAPGIGRRLDGWANRDLDVGTIISLAPDLSAFGGPLGVSDDDVRAVVRSWGPGKFDASLLLDGKAFREDGKPGAVLIPPAFGLAGVNLHTWTGWGSVSHWNALVANLEMGGQGTFIDKRLDDAERFPIAAREGASETRPEVDRVSPKLAALQLYQLALDAPKPPRHSFDRRAAKRGKALFSGQANCASCHVAPLFTEPGHNLHTPEEIGIDSFQADRSPTGAYRTSPLRGLWTHEKGGYYHDGRFATLLEVVEHYNDFFALDLNPEQQSDVVEYLKSL